MRHTSTLLLLWLLTCTATFSQDIFIADIRAHYNLVNKGVMDAQKQEITEKGLYFSNELRINSYQNAWPGTGRYEEQLTFWYQKPSIMTAARGNLQTETLHMVTVSSQRASTVQYTEYLYKGGQLLFVYSKEPAGDFRIYYQNEQPTRFKQNRNTYGLAEISPELTSAAAHYLDKSKAYQKLFAAMFVE